MYVFSNWIFRHLANHMWTQTDNKKFNQNSRHTNHFVKNCNSNSPSPFIFYENACKFVKLLAKFVNHVFHISWNPFKFVKFTSFLVLFIIFHQFGPKICKFVTNVWRRFFLMLLPRQCGCCPVTISLRFLRFWWLTESLWLVPSSLSWWFSPLACPAFQPCQPSSLTVDVLLAWICSCFVLAHLSGSFS